LDVREQMRDPLGNHPRFARAGTGNDQERPFAVFDRLTLFGV
jgi:hypothetical protein